MKQFAIASVLMLAAMAPLSAVEPTMELSKLQQLAASAQTAADHSEVSKQFRVRGEHFEAKAAAHESEALALKATHRTALAQKWPAMSNRAGQGEQQNATEARKTAAQSYARADKHLHLAVEALANADTDAQTAYNARR